MGLRKDLLVGFICSFFSIVAILYSCGYSSSDEPQPAAGTKEGHALAKQYCATCHSFVPAGSLDQITWTNKVLPGMAPKLGIGVFGETDYINNDYYGSGIISFNNWMKIVAYYTKNAPSKLEATRPQVPIVKGWTIFELKKPVHPIFPVAITMLTSMDTLTKTIYTSDGENRYVYRWNNSLQLTDSAYLGSPAVNTSFFDDENHIRKVVFSTLGTMGANDISEGCLVEFNLAKKLMAADDTLATNLPRPVQSVAADINKDGLRDWVVCGFGHLKGGLFWLQQLPGGGYRKNAILEKPGAVQAIAGDFDKDGWTDLMVLFAHDDESISLFTNDGKGSFISSRILTFPPVYGSSGFQLADFNKDGLMDILYTCGDNADLSKILKPFHGVYIYLNKGNNRYEQAFFYPINGCTKATAADFDKDGDLDIATIAFFADFKNNPAEKFIYFEHDKALHFTPHSPPIEKEGRWICMDVNDYDNDGDPDIILGNFAKSLVILKDYKPDWNMTTPFIVLENKTYKVSKTL